jgi:hypothetical protein
MDVLKEVVVDETVNQDWGWATTSWQQVRAVNGRQLGNLRIPITRKASLFQID